MTRTGKPCVRGSWKGHLSAGSEASPNKRNDLSLTSIFSFLLLKSDGRSHGEVRRATFDSKHSWSLPDGRIYCDKLFPPQFTLGTGHALERLPPCPYPDNLPGIWMTQEFIHLKGQECLLLSPKHPNFHPIMAGSTNPCPILYSHNCPWKIWNRNTQWIKHEVLCFSEQWLCVSVYTHELTCIILKTATYEGGVIWDPFHSQEIQGGKDEEHARRHAVSKQQSFCLVLCFPGCIKFKVGSRQNNIQLLFCKMYPTEESPAADSTLSSVPQDMSSLSIGVRGKQNGCPWGEKPWLCPIYTAHPKCTLFTHSIRSFGHGPINSTDTTEHPWNATLEKSRLRCAVKTLSALTSPEDRDPGALPHHQREMVKNGFEIWKSQGSNPASSPCVILGEFITLCESFFSTENGRYAVYLTWLPGKTTEWYL